MRTILFQVPLFLAFCPLLAVAQPKQTAKQTPSIEWLMGVARVGEYAVSPDGKQVVYALSKVSVAENKSEKDLYLTSTTTYGQPVVFTAEKGPESSPRWNSDGTRIGYLADQNGITQIWEANLDGSGKVCITTAPKDIDGFIYLPKNQGIIYTSKVKLDTTLAEKYADAPKTQARIVDGLLYRHWNRWADYSYAHLFYQATGKPAQDLMPGQPYDCPVPPMGGMEDVAVAPDGNYIIYACRKERGARKALSTNTDLYKVDLATGKTTNLTEGMLGYDRVPAISPDGKRVAFSSMAMPGNEADKPRLLVMELGNLSKKVDVTADFDEGVAGSPIWDAAGKGLYVPVHQKGTEQIFYFVADGSKPPVSVSDGRHNLAEVQHGAEGKLVCPRTAMDAPNDLVLLDPKNGRMQPITAANRELLAQTTLPKVESRWVKTTDGKEELVWHILPPNFDKNKKYPALLFCQGGPEVPTSQGFSYRWNFMVMAAQGYVIVAPCRRGMPGFGREWNDAIIGDWGGQPMRDLLSAIDDAATLPYVDRNRLACAGGSYGGFSAFFLAGIHERRFKAFISHCGVYNLESMMGTTDELFFNEHEAEGPFWKTPQPKSYTLWSPHKFVQNWDTPMLVIHGGLDFRVPEEQGMQAYTALQMRGIPSKFLYFPDEGHWVLKPQNSLVWHREFFAWLARYVK